MHLDGLITACSRGNDLTCMGHRRCCKFITQEIAVTQSKLGGRRIAVLAIHGFKRSELTESKRMLEEAGARVDVTSPGGAKHIEG